jgi:hypothetical protein
MSKFTPFPVPVHAADTPLVVANGGTYRCSGCGGAVPDGAWLFEVVQDGMVVGLLARVAGTSASAHVAGNSTALPLTAVHQADGEILHHCGAAEED